MSITDPLEVFYMERWGVYIVVQGRETFYDEERRIIEHETEEDAQEWIDDRKIIKGLSTRKTKRR